MAWWNRQILRHSHPALWRRLLLRQWLEECSVGRESLVIVASTRLLWRRFAFDECPTLNLINDRLRWTVLRRKIIG